MIKRIIGYALILLCIVGIAFQLLFLSTNKTSLLVEGSFDESQILRFQSMLDADELVISSGSYLRNGWGLVQDAHQRRYVDASVVVVHGDYVPPYAIRMIAGRFLAHDDQGAVVLSVGQASTLFCTYNCVGYKVLIDGGLYEVVGVYKPIGLASTLSQMGCAECFITAQQPQTCWVITITSGKETQREFTIPQMLTKIGVQNIVITPLFRFREYIFFGVHLQLTLLLFLAVIKLKRRISNSKNPICISIAKYSRVLIYVLAMLLFGSAVSLFPINPSYLPIAVTAEAIEDKFSELLYQWNNRIVKTSMESNYLFWDFIVACALSVTFWLVLKLVSKKRRD